MPRIRILLAGSAVTLSDSMIAPSLDLRGGLIDLLLTQTGVVDVKAVVSVMTVSGAAGSFTWPKLIWLMKLVVPELL